MKLSIIIPAYNEEKTIKELLNKVIAVNIGKIQKQIIIIDDCSTDNTFDIASKFNDVVVLKHTKNSGKGTAIRTGLNYANGDIIIIQDADLEYNPNNYMKLIVPIIDKKALVVYGSRRLNRTKKVYGNFSFYLGGEIITYITNILYPNLKTTDEPTCYKVFHKSVIPELKLECKRFEFCPEVSAKIAKLGYKLYEVPIDYFPRDKTEGKHINWRDGFIAIWELIRWRFKRFPK